MKWCRLSLLLILLGCYTPRYAFREVGTYPDGVYAAPTVSEQSPLEAKIAFVKAEKQERSDVWVVEFEMKFDNTGVQPVTLSPMEYALMDDEGHRIKAKAPDLSPNIQNFNLWPKSSLKVTMYFDLPAGTDMSRIGSLRMLWHYRIDSRLYRRVTKFLKHEVEYRYYPASYPHWYYYHPSPQYYPSHWRHRSSCFQWHGGRRHSGRHSGRMGFGFRW